MLRRRPSTRPGTRPVRRAKAPSPEGPSAALVAARGRAKAAAESGPRSGASGTALAGEALRTGIVPSRATCKRTVLPHEDDTIRAGDPDDDSMSNEYVGDETPGGSSSTPDQNVVDEIGRVYGLAEEGAGDFHSAGEILDRRDRHRAELRPPKKRRY
jgi:Family of unknown function (DUF6335)